MKIAVIVGSTREGRISPKIAKWVAKQAELKRLKTKLIDLKEYPMPFFDEVGSPQYNPSRKLNPVVKKFLDETDKYDGYVLVSPEYNRSYSAELKNALDYLDFQFIKKPVQLVSYGSTSGAQAIAHLRGVVPGVGGVTMPKAVMVNTSIIGEFDDDGNVSNEVAENPHGPSSALNSALDDLLWYTKALKNART